MPILCVPNWHSRPDLLLQQILSYNIAFDDDIVHVINVNSNFSSFFWEDSQKKEIDFFSLNNVYFVDPPVETKKHSIVQAYFGGVIFALKRNINFDYIYFHTASDIMIKRGAGIHVRQFDVGFGSSRPSKFTYEPLQDGGVAVKVAGASGSTQLAAIAHDRKIPTFLRSLGSDAWYKSRAEGCFFRRDVFFEIMYPLVTNFGMDYMTALDPAYPIEEYLWAQSVEFFCARHKVRRTRHMVTTSHNERNHVSIIEMDTALRDPNVFGIKRFTQVANSPEREYARKLLAI
jgi:hypothetical protein